MEGTVIVKLIEPLIGKPGQVRLLFRGLNGRWTLNDEKHPLLTVQLRPDGLIETSRDDGWDVLDPADVVAIEWSPEMARASVSTSDHGRRWPRAPLATGAAGHGCRWPRVPLATGAERRRHPVPDLTAPHRDPNA